MFNHFAIGRQIDELFLSPKRCNDGFTKKPSPSMFLFNFGGGNMS